MTRVLELAGDWVGVTKTLTRNDGTHPKVAYTHLEDYGITIVRVEILGLDILGVIFGESTNYQRIHESTLFATIVDSRDGIRTWLSEQGFASSEIDKLF